MVKKMMFLMVFLMVAAVQATVSLPTLPAQYSCNGSTTEFAFSDKILATSDIIVILRTVATGDETVLTETTDYSLSATNNDYSDGGTVTTVSTYSSAYEITLLRDVPDTQAETFSDSGKLDLAAITAAMDKLAMQIQQLQAELDRCLKMPRTDSTGLDMELANSVDRASQYLGFNGTGEPTVLSSGLELSTTTATAFGRTLVENTTAAAARSDLGLVIGTNVGYVDRGDPASNDFEKEDLTTDGTWNDLDLSSIVPANAEAVLLYVAIDDDAVSSQIAFRKNGNTNEQALGRVRVQVANVYVDADMVISLDSNRVIEYKATNTTFTGISICVKGWWCAN